MCFFRGSNLKNDGGKQEVSRTISAMFYRHCKPKVLKSKKQHRDSHGDSHLQKYLRDVCSMAGASCAILHRAAQLRAVIQRVN
jgi:hypothetical protein